MESAARKLNTVQDIYDLPDDVRMELIDGVLYDMATPSTGHQRIVFSLARKIADHIEKKGGSCETFIAPFAVFLNNDDRTYLEPDISVVCDRNKIKEDGCHGAPDWVIEVVSKSTRSRDYLVKLLAYKKAGVREYWIVDPESGLINVYHLEEETVEAFSFSDSITSTMFEGLVIDMKEIR